MVLIEGPADLTSLAPLLAHPKMQLPVALMAFATEQQGASVYYPFAEFSPEYQAIRWAVSEGIPIRFIDVPVAHQLADILANNAEQYRELVKPFIEVHNTAAADVLGADDGSAELTADTNTDAHSLSAMQVQAAQDPMLVLAQLAGFDDGESWWNQMFEQGGMDDPALFDSIASTMTALRAMPASADSPETTETAETLRREAYMRLQIAEARKAISGDIAVVCGAWHVPALQRAFSKKADKALVSELRSKLSAKQFTSTWIPWTSTRLALSSGYGAGVSAPQWYKHLWQHGNDQSAMIHWLTRVTNELRAHGSAVSTASVIDATTLCQQLAVVRNRRVAGFEEARDAAIASLCFGNTLLWQQLEATLLLGDEVGALPDDMPDDMPLAPLLVDLQQWQKRTRLKPSAQATELSLDLRSDAGLQKSILLRRLQLLDVHWGTPSGTGNSRGTFRERWVLQWQPELAVKLVEHQMYGSSIEQAAAALTSQRLRQTSKLALLADMVLTALEAQLTETAAQGIRRLADCAAQSHDCLELLNALPPLIDIHRYGTSRDMTLSHVLALVEQMAIQAALALPLAVRQLNDEESERYQQAIALGHQQLELAECSSEVLDGWWQALTTILHDDGCDAGARGISARLLYQAQRLSAEDTQGLLQRLLSPALPLWRTKSFFAGFFANASEQLLYDQTLRQLTDQWLMSLDGDSFIESLPLIRRVFSSLDAMERRRLLDAALQGTKTTTMPSAEPQHLALLPQTVTTIAMLMRGEQPWMT